MFYDNTDHNYHIKNVSKNDSVQLATRRFHLWRVAYGKPIEPSMVLNLKKFLLKNLLKAIYFNIIVNIGIIEEIILWYEDYYPVNRLQALEREKTKPLQNPKKSRSEIALL